MTRTFLVLFCCLPFLASCKVEEPVSVSQSLSENYRVGAKGISEYLDSYLSEGACPTVFGFDSHCTPSGLCAVSLTCYGTTGIGPDSGYAFTLNLDLLCLEGVCTLSTLR